jgi:asparagine synthase (glutamine-hydrolysing)
MSAIAGIYHINKEPITIEYINSMMGSLEKYPANDSQVWRKDNIFLGCHAQWITPESIGEKLPYYDYERKLAITSDAIIDNRDELFDKLGVDRLQRKTMPDSMLILLSYAKWGENVPYHLIGDFAFVIWDGINKKIFGARDFSGARTLYYFNKNQKFAFCTVMGPLLTLPYIKKNLNEEWLSEFLAIPSMIDSVSTSTTVIEDIQQLPPSHTITVADGKITISKYNIITINERLMFKKDEDYVEAFQDVFKRAVDSKLRTFRNVGSQLSGGLDSGSVVSYAAQTLEKQNKTLHTYSFVPTSDFIDWTPNHMLADESPFISSTVQFVGNIQDHYLSFDGINPYQEIDKLLEILEMPYKFYGNCYWISGIFEEANKLDIGVMLSGARGNTTISWGPALDYYGQLLKKLKLYKLFHEVEMYSKHTGIKSKKFLYSTIIKKAYPTFNRTNNIPNLQSSLINNEFARSLGVFEKLKRFEIDSNNSSKLSIFDFRKLHFEQDFRWNMTGTSTAKLSLRYGLWNRDPTNDSRVINFCLSLPENQYVKDGLDRALIRRATVGYLPDKVRLNQKVRGIQSADWVHRMLPSWNHFIQDLEHLVRDDMIAKYLNIGILKTALSNIKDEPRVNYAFNPDYKLLMRSLIVYRYITSFKGGDKNEKRMESANVGSARYQTNNVR